MDEMQLSARLKNQANPKNVSIKSTARLHMGFFDLHGGLGRKFGSIGLSLTEPALVISAKTSEEVSIFCSETLSNKDLGSHSAKIVLALLNKLNIKQSIALTIEQSITEHAGLGSGTQLALAIGRAISELYQLNLSSAQIAQLTGRGRRSGIGIAAFELGGLLIDGGRNHALNATPPLLARYDFPAQWRVLLILDNTQPGIHGDEELLAFNQLPIFDENLAAHLCRQVLMQTMPAMVEHDLNAFGKSIQVLQADVGDYFAPAQGGRYASQRVGAVLKYLQENNVACSGQSSWGPTGFAVFESAVIAEQYLQQLKAKFIDMDLDWMVCTAKNTGADVIVTKDI